MKLIPSYLLRNTHVALLGAVLAMLAPSLSSAIDTERADVQAFISEMVSKHDFDAETVRAVLQQGVSQPRILEAISRPAERTKPWHEYRAIFVTPKRINAGVVFMREHQDLLQKISEQTGVPVEIIVAIIGVETSYGRITGNFRVIDALATLAFDYPPRSKFFRSELEQFFLIAREEELELLDLMGSYAGAIGAPQFMPSSYRHYAVDGDGDGRRDLFSNWDDVFASVANYFAAHKWKPGEPVVVTGTTGDKIPPAVQNTLKMKDTIASLTDRGIRFEVDLAPSAPAQLIQLDGVDGLEYWVGFHNFYVITRYNRSTMYALSVFQLSQSILAAQEHSDLESPNAS